MADRQTDKCTHWKSAIFDLEDNWDKLLKHVPTGWKVYTKLEICPTTKKEHYQTHVDCGKQQRLSALCSWIKRTKWFTVVGKEHIQNSINYISKPDTTAPGAEVMTLQGEKYLRMHELLQVVARAVYRHEDMNDHEHDFYTCAKFIVADDVTFINKITNPICKTLWKAFYNVLLKKAEMEAVEEDGCFIIEAPGSTTCVEGCQIILEGPSIDE